MNDCLRQFILSLNQLEMQKSEKPGNNKVNRYLKKLDRKWKSGGNERQQYEEAFLKIVACQSTKERVIKQS